jgi:hypothetical protein
MLSSQHKEDIVSNRYIVKEKIEVLIPCGRRRIAIGGHTEDKNNSMAILRHISKLLKTRRNTSLTWIPPNSRIKYISPDIQNKIIEINGEMVREKLQERVISLNTLP